MIDMGAIAGLFFAALAAATVLPMQSEAALVALLITDRYPVWLLVAVASLGNVLGSVISWLIGHGIERYRDRRWFPVSPTSLERAQAWYQRHGKWSLLLSWAPVIGDPLTVVAGLAREPFPVFLALVTFAKVGRYVALAAATMSVA